jgi:hypothetical protein
VRNLELAAYRCAKSAAEATKKMVRLLRAGSVRPLTVKAAIEESAI